MNRSSQIPWTRILAAAIVVSILLALGINAWWDFQVARDQEHEQLLALRTEFQQDLLALDELVEGVQANSASLDELIALLNAANGRPVTIPARLLGAAITWRTTNVSTSALDALMASGNLNLLRDKELRTSLAGLPA